MSSRSEGDPATAQPEAQTAQVPGSARNVKMASVVPCLWAHSRVIRQLLHCTLFDLHVRGSARCPCVRHMGLLQGCHRQCCCHDRWSNDMSDLGYLTPRVWYDHYYMSCLCQLVALTSLLVQPAADYRSR